MAVLGLLLGIIGGLVGLAVGIGLDQIYAGPTAVVVAFFDLSAVKLAGVVIPLAAIVGGMVSRSRPLIGGVLMIVGGAGMALVFEIDDVMELAVLSCMIGAMMVILAGARASSTTAGAVSAAT
jgi:hypothetical protein